MVKQRAKVPRAMAQSSWKDEVTKPSRFLSVVSFCIGAWLAFVSLINVAFGAFAPGQKIEWLGFIDGSSLSEAYSAHSSISIGIGDVVALALAGILIVIGARGIESSSGLRAFLYSIIQRPRQMMSSEGDLSLIVANWMVVGGIVFYVIWSTINTTWVDPGVYSVSIVMIASGLGIEAIHE
ncbi:MAG TPA: hypothetical protein D7I12_05300 [Candidatus Poseidoniales archaeon]|nr:MAG TPA: hypothetical protein D7I12_05300 [Candidatus Poseidoniales archaeon]|tara:strand:+ start:643 stop:1185 length:543 start_codon:yes stop_codon:yes gene_type:complete